MRNKYFLISKKKRMQTKLKRKKNKILIKKAKKMKAKVAIHLRRKSNKKGIIVNTVKSQKIVMKKK